MDINLILTNYIQLDENLEYTYGHIHLMPMAFILADMLAPQVANSFIETSKPKSKSPLYCFRLDKDIHERSKVRLDYNKQGHTLG